MDIAWTLTALDTGVTILRRREIRGRGERRRPGTCAATYPAGIVTPMTRVDFYMLEQAGPAERDRFVCRLAEKAYLSGHRVYLHAPDPARAQALDALLWRFRDGSFVPHVSLEAGAAPEPLTPVHIGYGDELPEGLDDVLVNLGETVPRFFSRFERVAEVLDEAGRAAGRERFRFYRERGYELNNHTLSAGGR